MADVTMPQLGETVTEGTITKWLKAVGDQVERDEPLFEVSTDKVDSEVPSPVGGVLTEILVRGRRHRRRRGQVGGRSATAGRPTARKRRRGCRCPPPRSAEASAPPPPPPPPGASCGGGSDRSLRHRQATRPASAPPAAAPAAPVETAATAPRRQRSGSLAGGS